MHKIFVPHLNRHIVIGACKLPGKHRPRIRLSSYIDKMVIPPSPSLIDYSAPAMSVIQNVEGNDSVGDCVLAEEAHFVGVATGNTGQLYSYSAAQTLAAYSAITGYNPADPSTDQGTDPIACMNYFCQNPYADGTKLAGYAEVDANNEAEVQFALSAFGNLKMWIGLPDPWINPFPSGNGFIWDIGTANPNQGHCIGSPAYNSPRIVGSNCQGIQVMTWGMIGTITWRAIKALFSDAGGGGLAVRVTPDWLIKNSGKTPSGFAYADLCSDFNSLFGKSIPVPVTPSPAPPSPPGGVTLAQAQAWATSLIVKGHPLMTKQTAIGLINGGLSSGWPKSRIG
jgi:hypothetical protein